MTAQIIPFPCAHNEILALLAETVIRVQNGDVTGIMIATAGPERLNGAIETGWAGVGMAERSVMISHMQFDIGDSYMHENYIGEDDV